MTMSGRCYETEAVVSAAENKCSELQATWCSTHPDWPHALLCVPFGEDPSMELGDSTVEIRNLSLIQSGLWRLALNNNNHNNNNYNSKTAGSGASGHGEIIGLRRVRGTYFCLNRPFPLKES